MSDDSDIFSLENADDLPETLRAELNAFKRDRVERQIIELFSLAKRPLNIDEVLVGFYRKYGEEKDRRYMTIKLYNMSRSERAAIESVPKRKGMYKMRDNYDGS